MTDYIFEGIRSNKCDLTIISLCNTIVHTESNSLTGKSIEVMVTCHWPNMKFIYISNLDHNNLDAYSGPAFRKSNWPNLIKLHISIKFIMAMMDLKP
jgi:hypothetical protein